MWAVGKNPLVKGRKPGLRQLRDCFGSLKGNSGAFWDSFADRFVTLKASQSTDEQP